MNCVPKCDSTECRHGREGDCHCECHTGRALPNSGQSVQSQLEAWIERRASNSQVSRCTADFDPDCIACLVRANGKEREEFLQLARAVMAKGAIVSVRLEQAKQLAMKLVGDSHE